MPVRGSVVSTIKEEPYERLRFEAKNQRRTISDTLDIVLDFWDSHHKKEDSELPPVTILHLTKLQIVNQRNRSRLTPNIIKILN